MMGLSAQKNLQPREKRSLIAEKSLQARKSRELMMTILYHTSVLSLSLLMMYPLFWMLSAALKTHVELFARMHQLIPLELYWGNFIEGWQGWGRHTFTRFFQNSFVISGTITAGQVILAPFVAYGFARVKFYGKKALFAIVLGTLIVPMQLLMIPQFLLFNHFGWINTFLPLIIPGMLPAAFFIFLNTQIIRTLPIELDDAARIDGCGHFGIYSRILLPNIIPGLVTTAIFSFYWSWADFMGPLLYIRSARLFPVALALAAFSDPSGGTPWGQMLAMSTLSLIPIFIIFIFLQQHLVEGITTTGMKG